ncbi:MAG: pentapeptide repeat-containing protein [Gammaproteobacteria bacterium]
MRGVTLTQNTLSPEVFSRLKNDAQQDQALQHISGFYLQGKDLRGAILYEAVLPKIDLRAKTVSGLHGLLGCSQVPGNQQDIRCRSRLDGVDFRWAYLQQAMLDEASLIDAKLDHARLRDAVLSGADLRGADLRGADLSHTNFMCANLV